jgi:hypothetical protein
VISGGLDGGSQCLLLDRGESTHSIDVGGLAIGGTQPVCCLSWKIHCAVIDFAMYL